MDPYLNEWLNLILRFTHLVTGIAWIGASFYFIWLDNHLQTPPAEKAQRGVKGDLWAIHGGGFYEVAKYNLAPPTMPKTLHWFKWEAYSTWISGMLLLSLMYYVGAESYLIDPQVAALTPVEASALGLGMIGVGWLAYEGLCQTPLKHRGVLLGVLLLALVTAMAWGFAQLFSARGAYIHVGALIGTIMVGNVFRGIMPAQRALVNAVEQGREPDASYAENAKLRSTHNTYATLPLLFIMISNHYPMTYGHGLNWLALAMIIVSTAAIRQYFVLRHFNRQHWSWLAVACAVLIALALGLAPKPIVVEGEQLTKAKVSQEEVTQVIHLRCLSCHSEAPTDDLFKTAQGGVKLDSWEQILQWQPRIVARAVQSKDMPFINKTQMTDEERQLLATWAAQSAD